MKKFTKRQFKSWLMKQPKRRKFNMMNGDTCVGHAFLTETGRDEAPRHTIGYIISLSENNWFDSYFDKVADFQTAEALLKRL